MNKEQASVDLREANSKVADACTLFIRAYETRCVLDDLGLEHGSVPVEHLPENFKLEVFAFGAEEAMENYRVEFTSLRRSLKESIEEYYRTEARVLEELDN